MILDYDFGDGYCTIDINDMTIILNCDTDIINERSIGNQINVWNVTEYGVYIKQKNKCSEIEILIHDVFNISMKSRTMAFSREMEITHDELNSLIKVFRDITEIVSDVELIADMSSE